MTVPIDKRRPIKRATQDKTWFICDILEDAVVVCVNCRGAESIRKVKLDEFYDAKRYPVMIPTWDLSHTF